MDTALATRPPRPARRVPDETRPPEHRLVGREDDRLLAAVLADPARVSQRDAVALDVAIRRLPADPDPLRVTRVAAPGLALGRVAECREPLRRVVDDARRGLAGAGALTAYGLLCAGDVASGRWDEAGELAAEGVERCRRGGQVLAAAQLHLARAAMAAARGDEVRTRASIDAAVGRAALCDGAAVPREARRVQALAALGQGDAETAYRHATAVTPAGRLGAGTAPLLVSRDLVEAAVRLERWDDARRHVQAMREAPVHAVSPHFAMLTAASAAVAAEPGAAQRWFEEALAAPDADRWPFDHARTQLAYGEHLRKLRRTGPSRVLLDLALDTFLRLGARPWAARAQHGLRATGLTVGRPVDPGATVDLTPGEWSVASLAAAGLTNKQIARRLRVSHHTVAARLFQAFPKLGVGSRAALRLAMSGLDDGGGARTAPATALNGIA